MSLVKIHYTTVFFCCIITLFELVFNEYIKMFNNVLIYKVIKTETYLLILI